MKSLFSGEHHSHPDRTTLAFSNLNDQQNGTYKVLFCKVSSFDQTFLAYVLTGVLQMGQTNKNIRKSWKSLNARHIPQPSAFQKIIFI